MYQGVAITEDQQYDQIERDSLARSMAARGNLKIEPCMIISFNDNENTVNLLTDQNETISNVRVLNTIDEIYLLYGKPKDLKNLPANLYYEDSRHKGFVKIENSFGTKEKEGIDGYAKPFYL